MSNTCPTCGSDKPEVRRETRYGINKTCCCYEGQYCWTRAEPRECNDDTNEYCEDHYHDTAPAFPSCANGCKTLPLLGAGECEATCPTKFHANTAPEKPLGTVAEMVADPEYQAAVADIHAVPEQPTEAEKAAYVQGYTDAVNNEPCLQRYGNPDTAPEKPTPCEWCNGTGDTGFRGGNDPVSDAKRICHPCGGTGITPAPTPTEKEASCSGMQSEESSQESLQVGLPHGDSSHGVSDTDPSGSSGSPADAVEAAWWWDDPFVNFRDMRPTVPAHALPMFDMAVERCRTTITTLRAENAITSETSDGYHTFGELYHQRAVLFAALVNGRTEAWKSRLHSDGTMFDGGWFIVGVNTPKGEYTYHYDLSLWAMFNVREIPNAPEWDGHTADDVERLLSLPTAKATIERLTAERYWLADQCGDLCIIFRDPIKYRIEPDYWLAAAKEASVSDATTPDERLIEAFSLMRDAVFTIAASSASVIGTRDAQTAIDQADEAFRRAKEALFHE